MTPGKNLKSGSLKAGNAGKSFANAMFLWAFRRLESVGS